MSEKNRNIRKSFSRMISYLKGNIRGKERNSFERELQRDPFADEALEGLSSVSAQEAESDLYYLSEKLKKRSTRRRYTLYYSIAASVALLMLISSVYLMIQKKNVIETVAEFATKNEPIKIQVPAVQYAPKIEIPAVAMVEKTNSGSGRSKSKRVEAEPETVRGLNYDTISVSDISMPVVAMADKMASEPAAPRMKKESAKSYQFKGKILSSEDNLPVPGASVTVKGTATGVVTDMDGKFAIGIKDAEKRTLVANFIGMETKEFEAKADTQLNITMNPSSLALNEIVVVGYGSRKTDYDAAPETAVFTPSKPVNGKTAFDKYIEDNIRRPDTLTSGQRVVVVISFTVKPDGSRENYKIIKSPAKPFSDEALRLIISGPEWKPATENGIDIEDEVRLRVVFK